VAWGPGDGVVSLLNGLLSAVFGQGICYRELLREMADRLVRYVPRWVLDRRRHDLRVPVSLTRLIRR
jgi:hypothetical protein